jgi:hypothetical protein
MRKLLIGITLILGVVPTLLLGQTYNFGTSETVILGLGRDGTLVGQVDAFYGFIKKPGQDLQKIQYPNSIATGIVGIDAHCILGAYTSFFLDVVGFKQCDNQNTILYEFGLTFPTAMNGSGTVVGYYSPNGGSAWSGFIQHGNRTMQPFNVPGSTSTRIFAMDEKNRIAGDYNDQNGEHGFIWDGTTLATIDVKHAVGAVVTGLNDNCMVGAITLKSGNQEGFVRCQQNPGDDIRVSLGGSLFPRSLSPDGTIAGFFYDTALHNNSGFVLRKFAQ